MHTDSRNAGLQLDMLSGHCACETQDNRRKAGDEWTTVAGNCVERVRINVKVLIPNEFSLEPKEAI